MDANCNMQLLFFFSFVFSGRSRKPKYRSVGVQTDPIRRSVGVQTDFPDDDDHDYNVHANPNHTTGRTHSFGTQADASVGEHHDPHHHHDHHDPGPSIPRRFSRAEKGKDKADSDRSGPSCYRPPQEHFFQTTRPQPQENPTPPYHYQHPYYFYQDTRGVEDECRRFDEMPYGYYNYNNDPPPCPEWHDPFYHSNYYRGYYDIPHDQYYSPAGPLDNPWSYEPQGHGQNVEPSWGEKFAADAVAQLFGGVNPYYYGERY